MSPTTTALTGVVDISGQPVAVEIGVDGKRTTGTIKSPGGDGIDLVALARSFGLRLADTPAGLVPRVQDVRFAIDSDIVVFSATIGDVTAVVAHLDAIDALVVRLALDIGLPELPVVGPQLRALDDLRIDGLTVVAA